MNQQSEQQLEALFAQAYQDENFRAEFINQLLEANVYFPGDTGKVSGQGIEEHYLEENEKVQIKSWPNEEYGRVIPFFTSLNTMREAFNADENFICLPCKILFQMTLGSLLILNPESDVSKPFYPDEIQLLFQDVTQAKTKFYEEGTQLRLGQPADYPQKVIEQLKKYFSDHEIVSSAYIGQVQASDEEYPSLVVGVQLNEVLDELALEQINQNLSTIIKDSLQPIRPTALVFFNENEECGVIEEYLKNETKPFYEKQMNKKKGFFAKLFS